jgi:hypothetical protein
VLPTHGEEANLKVFKVEQIPMGEAGHYHGSCRVLPFEERTERLAHVGLLYARHMTREVGRR